MASPLTITDAQSLLLRADKIASVAGTVLTAPFLSLSAEPRVPRSGDLVLLRVTDASGQSVVELPNGRMAAVRVGDLVVGVLGQRRALKGFVGDVPAHLAVGDELAILNLGGVMGELRGRQRGLPMPLGGTYVGSVLMNGQIANLSQNAPATPAMFSPHVPLVLIGGTCMHAGKTSAAAEIIRRFAAGGKRVAAAKLTGVACKRDLLLMEDHGAIATMSFHDCGLPSTVDVPDMAAVARTIISTLQEEAPDVIVVELGDGLLGEYNVEPLFDDPALMAATAAIVVCANDFVGAWGAAAYLETRGVTIDVISGPTTDSLEAMRFVEARIGIPAANAALAGQKLFDLITEKIEVWQCKGIAPASSASPATVALS